MITAFGSYEDLAESVVIQADGKILVAGSCNTGSSYYQFYDFALARYNPVWYFGHEL